MNLKNMETFIIRQQSWKLWEKRESEERNKERKKIGVWYGTGSWSNFYGAYQTKWHLSALKMPFFLPAHRQCSRLRKVSIVRQSRQAQSSRSPLSLFSGQTTQRLQLPVTTPHHHRHLLFLSSVWSKGPWSAQKNFMGLENRRGKLSFYRLQLHEIVPLQKLIIFWRLIWCFDFCFLHLFKMSLFCPW